MRRPRRKMKDFLVHKDLDLAILNFSLNLDPNSEQKAEAGLAGADGSEGEGAGSVRSESDKTQSSREKDSEEKSEDGRSLQEKSTPISKSKDLKQQKQKSKKFKTKAKKDKSHKDKTQKDKSKEKPKISKKLGSSKPVSSKFELSKNLESPKKSAASHNHTPVRKTSDKAFDDLPPAPKSEINNEADSDSEVEMIGNLKLDSHSDPHSDPHSGSHLDSKSDSVPGKSQALSIEQSSLSSSLVGFPPAEGAAAPVGPNPQASALPKTLASDASKMSQSLSPSLSSGGGHEGHDRDDGNDDHEDPDDQEEQDDDFLISGEGSSLAIPPSPRESLLESIHFRPSSSSGSADVDDDESSIEISVSGHDPSLSSPSLMATPVADESVKQLSLDKSNMGLSLVKSDMDISFDEYRNRFPSPKRMGRSDSSDSDSNAHVKKDPVAEAKQQPSQKNAPKDASKDAKVDLTSDEASAPISVPAVVDPPPSAEDPPSSVRESPPVVITPSILGPQSASPPMPNPYPFPVYIQPPYQQPFQPHFYQLSHQPPFFQSGAQLRSAEFILFNALFSTTAQLNSSGAAITPQAVTYLMNTLSSRMQGIISTQNGINTLAAPTQMHAAIPVNSKPQPTANRGRSGVRLRGGKYGWRGRVHRSTMVMSEPEPQDELEIVDSGSIAASDDEKIADAIPENLRELLADYQYCDPEDIKAVQHSYRNKNLIPHSFDYSTTDADIKLVDKGKITFIQGTEENLQSILILIGKTNISTVFQKYILKPYNSNPNHPIKLTIANINNFSFIIPGRCKHDLGSPEGRRRIYSAIKPLLKILKDHLDFINQEIQVPTADLEFKILKSIYGNFETKTGMKQSSLWSMDEKIIEAVKNSPLNQMLIPIPSVNMNTEITIPDSLIIQRGSQRNLQSIPVLYSARNIQIYFLIHQMILQPYNNNPQHPIKLTLTQIERFFFIIPEKSRHELFSRKGRNRIYAAVKPLLKILEYKGISIQVLTTGFEQELWGIMGKVIQKGTNVTSEGRPPVPKLELKEVIVKDDSIKIKFSKMPPVDRLKMLEQALLNSQEEKEERKEKKGKEAVESPSNSSAKKRSRGDEHHLSLEELASKKVKLMEDSGSSDRSPFDSLFQAISINQSESMQLTSDDKEKESLQAQEASQTQSSTKSPLTKSQVAKPQSDKSGKDEKSEDHAQPVGCIETFISMSENEEADASKEQSELSEQSALSALFQALDQAPATNGKNVSKNQSKSKSQVKSKPLDYNASDPSGAAFPALTITVVPKAKSSIASPRGKSTVKQSASSGYRWGGSQAFFAAANGGRQDAHVPSAMEVESANP